MKKEAILFVLSTAGLVYFIAPTGGSDEEPVAVEKNQVAKVETVEDDEAAEEDDWDSDEEDEEEFVFGQPMISTEPDYESAEDSPVDEVDNSDETGSDNADRFSSSTTTVAIPKNPGPGELGSKTNPVSMDNGKRRSD